jgi:hypothetical protein
MIELGCIREIGAMANAAGSLNIPAREERLLRSRLRLVSFLFLSSGALAAVTHYTAPVPAVVWDQRISAIRLLGRGFLKARSGGLLMTCGALVRCVQLRNPKLADVLLLARRFSRLLMPESCFGYKQKRPTESGNDEVQAQVKGSPAGIELRKCRAARALYPVCSHLPPA